MTNKKEKMNKPYYIQTIGNSLSLVIYNALKQNPELNISQIEADTGRILTFSDVQKKCFSLVHGLCSIGVTENSRVVILTYNSQESQILFLSLLLMGATAVMVDHSCQDDEICHMLKQSEPDFIYNDKRDMIERLEQILSVINFSTKNLIVNSSESKYLNINKLFLDTKKVFVPNQNPDTKHACAIFHTSGSTGMPKGVILPESYMLKTPTIPLPDMEESTVLVSTSMCWISGFYYLIRNLVLGYKHIFLNDRKNAEFMFETIQKYKVNEIFAHPSTILLMAKYPKSSNYNMNSLKIICVGGQPINKYYIELITNKLKISPNMISQLYGATELGMVGFSEPFINKIGSIGKVREDIELKIINPDTQEILGSDTEGEICVRADNFMIGYVKNPEATAAMFDKDGWFHVGDIGLYDKDGYLFVKERMNYLIKYKNFKISPTEIECALLSHPKIIEAVVFGIKHPVDGEWPVAVVVCDKHTTAEEVLEYIKSAVPPEHTLRGGIHLAESLPKSANGKIKRGYVRDKYLPLFSNNVE